MFNLFANAVNARLELLSKMGVLLFETNVDKDKIFSIYINAFPKGTNELHITNTEHDCTCCRHFIQRLGHVKFYDTDTEQYSTIWDLDLPDDVAPEYKIVARALHEYVMTLDVVHPFLCTNTKFGNKHTVGDEDKIWDHFYGSVSDKHLVEGRNEEIRKENLGTAKGKFMNNYESHRRSITEMEPEHLELIIDLIEEGVLPRGEEKKEFVAKWLMMVKNNKSLDKDALEHSNWLTSMMLGERGNFRNSAIGSLALDLQKGKSVDDAVGAYTFITRGDNYGVSTTAPTEFLMKRAKKELTELGYLPSLERKLATFNDLPPEEMAFTDVTVPTELGMFDVALNSLSTADKSSKMKSTKISLKDFMETVLPNSESMDMVYTDALANRIMTLVTAKNEDAKPLFNYESPISWAYAGDVADAIDLRVAREGGKTDGVARVSLIWDYTDDLDLDVNSQNETIYYGNKVGADTGGYLDIDANYMSNMPNPVENITWPSLAKMENKTFNVRVFNNRCDNDGQGCTVKVVLGNKEYLIELKGTIRNPIDVAQFTCKNGEFTFKSNYPFTEKSKGLLNINSGTNEPVTAAMYSPNYWGTDSVGSKHVFFMFKNAKNPESVRGFFSEFLGPELHTHRKSIQYLAGLTKAPYSEEQLSGVGFSMNTPFSFDCVVSKRDTKELIKYTVTN